MSKKIEDSQTVLEEKSLLVPSPEGLKEDVNYLKEWIAQEPDLPNISDEEWLTTFLCNNKFSLERTKRKLVNYYVYRSKYPNVLMRSRDPSSMEALQTMKAFRLGSLQRLTKDGCKLIYSSWSPEFDNFSANEVLKRVFMAADVMTLERIRLAKTIVVADCGALTYRHYLRLTPILTQFGDIMINGHTERIKAIYFINAARWICELLEVLKHCVPATLSSRMHIFSSPNEKFRQEFHEHDLSIDYGGKASSLDELTDVFGLRNVRLSVSPPTVKRGEGAALDCIYDLEHAPLYSFKLYRGYHEFYRFSPNHVPENKAFPLPGVTVDLARSNASRAVLHGVGFHFSGNITCEVTTDAPDFVTVAVSKDVMVVELPEDSPLLMTERNKYEPGETLRANCSSLPSRPVASLSFLLNNAPVSACCINVRNICVVR
ncbi:uncharacterized protein [Bemisia tabaci]|uniref:uncharacterized protein isoform X3 n=1 Tax=Bemisia tabaci TaxID=7038 RepID=UPI003B2850E4